MNQQQRAVWEKVVELLEDNREYIEADERPEYLALYDKAIADANALLKQPEQPTQCWKCGDMDAVGHAKCDVPACGMKEQPEPVQERSCGNCKHLHRTVCVGCHDGIHNRWEPTTPPAQPAPVQEPVAELMHEPDVEVLRQQMKGRAQFLRDRGEVKTPQLLEIASELITPPATGKDQP